MNAFVRFTIVALLIAAGGLPRPAFGDGVLDHSGVYQSESTYRRSAAGDSPACNYPQDYSKHYGNERVDQSSTEISVPNLERYRGFLTSYMVRKSGTVSSDGSFEIIWEDPETSPRLVSVVKSLRITGRFDENTFVATAIYTLTEEYLDNLSEPVRDCVFVYDLRLVPSFSPWACELTMHAKRFEVLQDSVGGIATMGHGDEWNVTSTWDGRAYTTTFHTGGLAMPGRDVSNGIVIDEHPDTSETIGLYRLDFFPFTRLLTIGVQQHVFEYGPSGTAEDGSFIPGPVVAEFDLSGESRVAVPLSAPAGCPVRVLRDLHVVVQGFEPTGGLPFEVRITYDFRIEKLFDPKSGVVSSDKPSNCAVSVSLARLAVLEDLLDPSVSVANVNTQNRWLVTSAWDGQSRTLPVYSGGTVIGRDVSSGFPFVDNLTDTAALKIYPKAAFPIVRPLSVTIRQHVWEYASSPKSDGAAAGFVPPAVAAEFDRVGSAERNMPIACPGYGFDDVVVRGAAEGGGADFAVRLTYEMEATEVH